LPYASTIGSDRTGRKEWTFPKLSAAYTHPEAGWDASWTISSLTIFSFSPVVTRVVASSDDDDDDDDDDEGREGGEDGSRPWPDM
jgi:hypothetical protein